MPGPEDNHPNGQSGDQGEQVDMPGIKVPSCTPRSEDIETQIHERAVNIMGNKEHYANLEAYNTALAALKVAFRANAADAAQRKKSSKVLETLRKEFPLMPPERLLELLPEEDGVVDPYKQPEQLVRALKGMGIQYLEMPPQRHGPSKMETYTISDEDRKLTHWLTPRLGKWEPSMGSYREWLSHHKELLVGPTRVPLPDLLIRRAIYETLPYETIRKELNKEHSPCLDRSVEEYIELVVDAVSPPERLDVVKIDYHGRVQNEEESPVAFYKDKLHAFQRAYPVAPDYAAFFNDVRRGLINSHLAERMRLYMSTVDRTRGLARYLTAYRDQMESNAADLRSAVRYGEIPWAEALGLKPRGEEGEGWLKELATKGKRRVLPGIHAIKASDLTCYFCNKKGHMARDCNRKKQGLPKLVQSVDGDEGIDDSQEPISQVEMLESTVASLHAEIEEMKQAFLGEGQGNHPQS